MKTTLRSIVDMDEDSVARWRALASVAIDPNPFFEPEFLVPAAELVADAPRHLVVVERDGEWLAALPFAGRRLRTISRASEAGVARYGFLSTPLLAPGDVLGTVAALLERIAEATNSRPLLMQRLDASGPFSNALGELIAANAALVLERQDFERAFLTKSDGSWHDHLGSHHMREQRRLRRRLGEELGGEVEVRQRAGDEAAMERFLELELAGWKGRAGTALASRPSEAEFFRRLCRGFHAAGRLHLLDLGVGDRTAAINCNLHAGRGSFAFKTTFDERYSRWSPGLQLEHENTELFQASDREWLDSCAQPDNTTMNRLWPGRRALTTLVVGDPCLRGRARTASLAVTRRLRAGRAFASAHMSGT